MPRKSYSEQFKRDAVGLVINDGYTVNAAAEAVGVAHGTMSKWVARYGGDAAVSSEREFASKDDELKALRAEIVKLRMEREILRKAAAFFAKDQ